MTHNDPDNEHVDRGLDADGETTGLIDSNIELSPFLRWWLGLSDLARALINNPQKVILGLVVGWFANTFVYPFVDAFVAAGSAIITAIMVFFLGNDQRLAAEGSLGVAEVLLFGVVFLADVTQPVVMGIIGTVEAANQAIASLAEGAGIGAPVIVTTLYMVEVGAVLYGLWFIIRAVDVPFINLGPILSTLTAPYRWFIRGVS